MFIVFVALLIGNISLVADANQLKTIQHKQRVTHEKIKRLKVLEHLEKNKLYKNQQKLEQATNPGPANIPNLPREPNSG